MFSKSDVVVIGGGAMGLSVGYSLLRKGVKTTILEGSYLNSGSTGRNMGILKRRLGSEDLVRLAVKGLELHKKLPSQLGVNTFFRKSGRLLVAKNEEELQQLKESHSFYKGLGLKEVWLSPEEIAERWPYIDAGRLVGGYFDPEEAIIHPFALTWAYFESIKRLKGMVKKQNMVKSLQKAAGSFSIITESGVYEAEKIVIACGAHSGNLLEQLGFKLKMAFLRKEALVSEPIRPFLDPVIERPIVSYEVAQTMRGEIVGTMGFMSEGYDLSECTPEFLHNFASETLQLIPSFRYLRVLRQWVGICDKTIDSKPLIGSIDEKLYITCGYYDYGMIMAPVVGQLLAEAIVDGTCNPLIRPFDPHRFD